MPLLKNCEPKVNAFSSDILYKIWTSVGSDITASNMCFLRHKTYTWVVAQLANKLFLTGSISSSGKQPSQTIWALPKIYSCHFAKLAWKGRRKNFGRRNLQTLKVKVQRVQISRLTQQGQKLGPASDQPTAETTYFDKKCQRHFNRPIGPFLHGSDQKGCLFKKGKQGCI